MVTVPNVAAFSPHLSVDPVIVYVSDHFQKPYPFTPNGVVAIDSVIEQKIDMMHAHESQVYEWLPYNGRYLDKVPSDVGVRRAWLAEQWAPRMRRDAARFRPLLDGLYGAAAANIQYAEAFEGCEYGAPLTQELIPRLFPFFS